MDGLKHAPLHFVHLDLILSCWSQRHAISSQISSTSLLTSCNRLFFAITRKISSFWCRVSCTGSSDSHTWLLKSTSDISSVAKILQILKSFIQSHTLIWMVI